jgi:hypothetical protein
VHLDAAIVSYVLLTFAGGWLRAATLVGVWKSMRRCVPRVFVSGACSGGLVARSVSKCWFSSFTVE